MLSELRSELQLFDSKELARKAAVILKAIPEVQSLQLSEIA